MEKREALVKFLKELPTTQLVAVHNEYCKRNNFYNMICHPMDTEHINYCFGTAGHLFLAIKNTENFNPSAKYFQLANAEIRTDIVMDIEALAEYLIRWGDELYSFDNTNALKFDCTYALTEAFKSFASNCLRDLSDEQISNIVEASDEDFLMDDWNDIIIDLFPGINTICPHCQYALMSEERGEYDYDSGLTFYTCPECGETISC